MSTILIIYTPSTTSKHRYDGIFSTFIFRSSIVHKTINDTKSQTVTTIIVSMETIINIRLSSNFYKTIFIFSRGILIY